MDHTSSSSIGSWQLDSELGVMNDQDQMTYSSSSSSLSSSLRPPAKSCSRSDQSTCIEDEVDQQVGPKEPKAVAGGASKRTKRTVNAQMAQMFLDLGSLIPGFNKIDKVSIIEEAAKYIKQLEEQIRLLEQQIVDNPTDDKSDRSSACSEEDDDDNNNEIYSKTDDNPGLDIKAKASGKEILMTVFCKKEYDLVPKIFNEISKLHLTPLNSNIITFAEYALDITIVAQMEGEFCMTMENLVKHLRRALE